jgi:hypothetical protein
MNVLPATYESIRVIAAEHQASKLHWPKSDLLPKGRRVLVDATTAHALVAVYNGANDENKAKIEVAVKRGPHMVAKLAALAWGK